MTARKLVEAARAERDGIHEERRERKQSGSRIRDLERLVDEQAATIERLQSKRFRYPSQKPGKSGKAEFCRVIVPDSHGCFIDPKAAAAFLADLAIIKPAEIIMLGDHLDCGGFLAEHHTLGYVAQAEYSFWDDVDACNQFLDSIQAICPKARIDYLEGNHERRIETFIVTRMVRNPKDGERFRALFSSQTVLALGKRGINWIRQGVTYDDLPIQSTIKRGSCHFTHGTVTAKHAAAGMLAKFGGCVVFGHTHRADSFVQKTVRAGTIGAWNPGCLCQLQPLWQHSNPTDWSHGYGLQMVSGEGFLHINVPIIDGVSYLAPLAGSLR